MNYAIDLVDQNAEIYWQKLFFKTKNGEVIKTA